MATKPPAKPKSANKSSKTNHPRVQPPQPATKPIRTVGENEMVVTQPARCVRPSCRSTDVEPVQGIPIDVTVQNTTVRGLPVTHILRERMVCRTCGQRFVKVEHQNRPGTKQ